MRLLFEVWGFTNYFYSILCENSTLLFYEIACQKIGKYVINFLCTGDDHGTHILFETHVRKK